MSGIAPLPPVATLLPHDGPAILLDRVLQAEADSLVAGVQVRRDSAYAQDIDAQSRGVPAHVAIEYMAQACAAWAGLEAQGRGEAPRIGLLLGTRDFRASRPWFAPGDALEVAVKVSFRDGSMGVFDASVSCAGATLCTAQITVYQPDDDDRIVPAAGSDGRDDDG